MPQLVAWDKKYRDNGLQVIGIHCQDGTDAEVMKVANDLRVKFPITTGGRSAVNFSGIPRMFVFGSKGDLIYQGHPMDEDADKIIKRALREIDRKPAAASAFAPAELIPQRAWTNTDGRTITAAVVSADASNVKFKMPNGAVVSYALDKLAAADRQAILDAARK